MSNNNDKGFRRSGVGGRQINFDDDDFAGKPSAAPKSYGKRDSDWADDIATRADGRITAEFDERHGGAATRRPSAARRRPEDFAANARGEQSERSRIADDYRDDTPRRKPTRRYDDDDDDYEMERPKSFVRRHPVLMNFCYAVLAAILVLWALMWFLDYWTFHGEERVVPDVKGQTYATAAGNVDLSGLRAVITDSVFDSYNRPGTVVEQVPVPGARIKKGGSVYLTIVAFTPKLVSVPDFFNTSARQARSMFRGLGISDIREETVVSEYAGLVLGAKFNGVPLQPGQRIPVSATITLEVGSGYSLSDDFGADVDTLAIDNVIDELSFDD